MRREPASRRAAWLGPYLSVAMAALTLSRVAARTLASPFTTHVGTLADATYDLERLRSLAVMLSAGEQEGAVVEAAKAQIEALKALGIATSLFVAPGATHGSMIAPTMPKVLEFFAGTARKR